MQQLLLRHLILHAFLYSYLGRLILQHEKQLRPYSTIGFNQLISLTQFQFGHSVSKIGTYVCVSFFVLTLFFHWPMILETDLFLLCLKLIWNYFIWVIYTSEFRQYKLPSWHRGLRQFTISAIMQVWWLCKYIHSWASYQMRTTAGLGMQRECREHFPCHWLERKPLFSDPGMHTRPIT